MSTNIVTLAVDAMGGDQGVGVIIDAVAKEMHATPILNILLFGQEDILTPLAAKSLKSFGDRVQIRHAPDVVTMNEHPRQALRQKKNSSMRLGINAVRDGEADGCISGGNTGALMATAHFVLRPIAGIERSAIMAPIPSESGSTWMLDLGANAACTAEHLHQFAIMGSVFAEQVGRIEKPRVGLLNIGEEAIKGTDTIQQANQLMQDSRLNYVGFVEANDIYSAKVDVVVTDGFTGNVALKAMEGTARFIRTVVKNHFKRNLWARLLGVLALPALLGLRKPLDPGQYNGASFLGLRGVVVKSHGNADAAAFRKALQTAVVEVQTQVPTVLAEALLEE
ncbi:MAG: phosphate acyltransferase PlsX [Gammaproteobacteria bacterium]|nr:phosphate acyltransferase PlsX [Gammaproteobacteria bacterium]